MNGAVPALVRSKSGPELRSVVAEVTFGMRAFATVSLPDRLYAGLDSAQRPSTFRPMEPALDCEEVPTPLEMLVRAPSESKWVGRTRRALDRLEALWLLIEDRHRLLDADPIEPLAHQVSLVEHVLRDPHLNRVMVADEVGLGKTVEAGLILKRLVDSSPGNPPRILYLTEAGLVDNVAEEFRRLGLRPRRWTSEITEAVLTPGDSDRLVIASIHRSVFRSRRDGGVDHFGTVSRSGPWDVLVVDEAHHLSDYSSDGNDPAQRMRLVRALVNDRLNPGGRLILLTGTPHQGHVDRFRNLLRLLSTDNDERAARGRVIYRIKDDIVDWDGEPLFPARDVRPPTLVEVGADYQDWLREIHELLRPRADSRAAGWRRAQALQWAASSPQAGLAYLVRLTLRAGFSSRTLPELVSAISALRPYRGGAVDEPIGELEGRLVQGLDDREGEESPDFADDREALGRVLELGARLIEADAFSAKLQPLVRWLTEHRDDKFVVFAQPIETVHTIRSRLEAVLGPGSVSVLVGGQLHQERQRQIQAFWTQPNVRVLVSSKSGGEGINLQISNRLVHFDVPWNPMELEQRVGRVHRFGSVSTIVVETLVLDQSREQRVLARCRARLGQIVSDLDQERVELLYRRTMSAIPLEELGLLMAGENFGPLTPADEARLDRLVQEGYERWQAHDSSFRAETVRLRTVERGPVGDEDLERFLVDVCEVRELEGWRRRTFVAPDEGGREPRLLLQPARVYEHANGTRGYVGRDAGVGLVGPDEAAPRLNRWALNHPLIAGVIRSSVSDEGDDAGGAGVALVGREQFATWARGHEVPERLRSGAVFLAYLVRYLEIGSSARETSTELRYFMVDATGEEEFLLSREAAAELIRLLRGRRAKRGRPTDLSATTLVQQERSRLAAWRQAIAPGAPVPAVFPFAAVWVEPSAELT